MNQFQFTITDNTQSPAVVTVIDEPVGWDGLEFKLTRSSDWHGFFDYFDKDVSMLEFDGVGFGILKEAYELVGVEAEVTLLIEFRCSETDTFEEIYEGNFDFSTYNQFCGDRCYIKINVTTTSCLVQFKNRYDQKVNVESLRTFDLPDGDADDLLPYAGIGFEMLLEPNEIWKFSRWFQETFEESWEQLYSGADLGNWIDTYFRSGVQNLNSDIETSNVGLFEEYQVTRQDEFPFIEITTGPNISYTGVQIDVHFKGHFYDEWVADSGGIGTHENDASGWIAAITMGDDIPNTGTIIDSIQIVGNYSIATNANYDEAFDITLSATVNLVAGDKIWIDIFTAIKDTNDVIRRYRWAWDEVEITAVGFASSEATNSKVSLINETASRVTEIITGDCLRVYSDYYGREDAEPYVSADDGCGSLRVLSNGLFIRRALQVDDTEPQHTLSMKDMFEALSAIDCIGMGVEPDPNRAGYEMLRIERFQYFYDTTVLLTCTGVAKTERTIYMDGIFSTFKSGYGKYETETVGGRNEIHTKRNFRTTLKTIQKELVKICPFIASGHSIEITRWQVGNTSQDWRYDTDTFVICVARDVLYENGWKVDRGTDQTAVNLPNYDTVYNVQISPQRNARRWTPIVFQCYVDFANGVMKFMNGDGNLIAETFIYAEPSANDCGVELIDIGSQPNTPENSDIDYTKFNSTNKSDFYPIFKPERISFQYPLSYTDWKIIKASPTGLIGFECNGTTEYGWIDELNYRPVEGMADFVLIPQQPDIIEEG